MVDTLLDRTTELLYEARVLCHETQQLVWDLHKTVAIVRQFRANTTTTVKALELAISNEKAPKR